MNGINQFLALARTHPEVAAVLIYVAVTAAHVVVGALLHATRLNDFDWRLLGKFIESDWAATRGVAILTTFAATLATSLGPDSDWRAAFTPAFLALVGACTAGTLPLVRDTLYNIVYLLSGVNPAPTPSPPAVPIPIPVPAPPAAGPLAR